MRRPAYVGLLLPAALATLLLSLSALLVPAASARADTSPGDPPAVSTTTTTNPTTGTDTEPVPLTIRLTSLRPIAPQPGNTLVVTGSVRNTGSVPLTNVLVTLLLGPSVTTRGAFEDYAADPTAALPADVDIPLGPSQAVNGGQLAAGRSATFRLTFPVDDLALPPNIWEIRELGLSTTGLTPDEVLQTSVLRTFLPWAPSTDTTPGHPMRVAWVWPLVDRPHRGISSTWYDASLAGELRAGGRLADLLGVADNAETQRQRAGAERPATRPVPVSFALDPMLLDDVATMTKPYTVTCDTNSRHVCPGPGGSDASSWLGELRTVSTRPQSEFLAIPYADPDVVAAVRDDLSTQVGVALTNGRTVLDRDLPGSRLIDIGWPADGQIDQRSAEALYAAQVTSLVLSDSALPVVGGEPSETPSARAKLETSGGDIGALLTDGGLAGDVSAGLAHGADAGLARNRFLAETLMIQIQGPSDNRSLVLAPDRRWDPTLSYAAGLLQDTGKVPWIRPVSLSSVADEPIDTDVDRGPLTYPSTARQDELSPGYTHDVAALQSETDDFGAILPAGDSAVSGDQLDIQRALSSAYRTDEAGQQRLSHDQASLAADMSQVHITSAAGSFVTLTSHRGIVPVTVANDLDTDVKVVLAVEANQRLVLPRNGRVSLVIPAHEKVPVDVHARAKTSGVFPLDVRLFTPNGHPYGSPVRLNVRSTVYGTITLAITGAAMALLLIAVAVRLVRRGIAARRGGGETPRPAT